MAPAAKRRKTGQPEEIVFDPAARQDYLTGFHKRKEARKKHAQETAAKLEKEEKVKARKELRDQRKADLQNHIAEFNAELKKQNPDLDIGGTDSDDGEDAGEWAGIDDAAEAVRDEDEYVDEDKYTTVTVEPMGMESEEEPEYKKPEAPVADEKSKATKKRPWAKKSDDGKPKPKKKKFRYETKAERQITREKQKKNSRAAKARRQAGDKEK